MSSSQKALVGSTGVLLLAFVMFGVHTWVRILEVIPASSNCQFTLIKISRQSAMVRPFFVGAFVVSLVVFEFSRRWLPGSWRLAYLITLGLGAALLIAPWLVHLVQQYE